MIKHVVMWRFKAEVSASEKGEMKRRLEALKGLVPSLMDIEVGFNLAEGDAAMDMVLYSVFEDMAGLAAYATHPEHVKVVEFVKPLVNERAVVDYEV
jgi:quinol monooxygenase YgiN